MTLLLESFVFGVANSLHCACMCGPLALAFQGGTVGALSYHVGRSVSYAFVGLVLGGIGARLGSTELGTPSAYVAFVLAGGLIVLALLGERGAVSIPGLGSTLQRGLARTRSWSPTWRAGALGVFTPLLPCGLLWSAFAGATVAGSPIAGAEVMGGFALGSLPLLLAAQLQASRLARRFGPRTLLFVQRTAMLLAAGTLIWRGLVSLGGEGSCCH
ncbi:MAG TPA: sulfite exporter TauE/SafE family protein [bacterium]|nr:sulfite exporter TauE/SafE family protein [bacterium]